MLPDDSLKPEAAPRREIAEVSIRPYHLGDAFAVWEAARESLAEMRPWMPWCHQGYTLEESRAWLEVQVPAFEQRKAFEFAIASGSGDYLGGCGLNQIDALHKRANLGYWVRSSARRRGVATRAIGLLRDWAFASTDLIRLELVVATGNAASRRAAEKSGAIFEAMLRSRLLLDGIAHDALIFSFIRPGAAPAVCA